MIEPRNSLRINHIVSPNEEVVNRNERYKERREFAKHNKPPEGKVWCKECWFPVQKLANGEIAQHNPHTGGYLSSAYSFPCSGSVKIDSI